MRAEVYAAPIALPHAPHGTALHPFVDPLTRPCCLALHTAAAVIAAASSAYGAEDLSQANTVYLDSHWGLGASVRELVQGVDCPMTAAYLDAATFYKGSSKVNVHKNAICVFEHNPGGWGGVGLGCGWGCVPTPTLACVANHSSNI